LNQLAAAVRLFAAEFTVSSQLGKCLAVVGQRTPDPVGGVFKRACFRLAYGGDADAVFRQMEEELDSPYGRMFVQIIRAAREKGHAVAPLLHDLVSRITVAQELARSNRSEVSGERWVGLLFAVLPLPLYFLLQAWIPEAGAFLTGTAAGHVVVFASFLSAIAWFYVDRVVNET
jgi:pilus assembly protein CpaF